MMSSMQGRPVTASKDADVILPPASPLNPVPALPAALRIDNREALLSLLQSIPGRQLLVFGCESLRTLVMRQVLSDPHGRVFKGKKNWDAAQFFPLPHGLQIVGTKVLPDNISTFNLDPTPMIGDVWDEKSTLLPTFSGPPPCLTQCTCLHGSRTGKVGRIIASSSSRKQHPCVTRSYRIWVSIACPMLRYTVCRLISFLSSLTFCPWSIQMP